MNRFGKFHVDSKMYFEDRGCCWECGGERVPHTAHIPRPTFMLVLTLCTSGSTFLGLYEWRKGQQSLRRCEQV